MNPRWTIRRAENRDLPQLLPFFEKAYGAKSIFVNADYVSWFQGAPCHDATEAGDALNSYVAIGPDGVVVAHYGYIPTTINVGGTARTHIWGVNAYTLPQFRGEGLGRHLVDAVRAGAESFGVIGFSEATADFYASIGFNVFEKQRFARYVLVLDAEIQNITKMIGTHRHRAASRLEERVTPPGIDSEGWTVGTSIGAWQSLRPRALAETCSPARTRNWLEWRYSPRSRLTYQTQYASSRHGHQAVIASRAIRLAPSAHSMTRVVDLYGDLDAAEVALSAVCDHAARAGHLYVEFAMFGDLYRELLSHLGFISLQGDDSSVLPWLTNPVTFRPNTEYVGLACRDTHDWATALRSASVYFTAADSDRDRCGSLAG